VLGHKTALEWAAFTDISNATWANYEAGTRMIAVPEALKLAQETGATLDWIYAHFAGARGRAAVHLPSGRTEGRSSGVSVSPKGIAGASCRLSQVSKLTSGLSPHRAIVTIDCFVRSSSSRDRAIALLLSVMSVSS
jgi:hypothetical protein